MVDFPPARRELIRVSFVAALIGLSQLHGGPQTKPIQLDVDATDTRHKIFAVRETIAVQRTGPMVLLYPRWDTGSHAPTISVANLAGLLIQAAHQRLEWQRDGTNPHAFHLIVPAGIKELDLEFQYLSPPIQRAGAMLMTPDIIEVPWQNMVLYPAGQDARDIPVRASLTLPPGFHFASALETSSQRSSQQVLFALVSLQTLVDSPVYAGRHFRQWDLAPFASTPVRLNVFADSLEDLAASPEEIARIRALIDETHQIFQSRHYNHYDFLVSLSDLLPNDGGLEHLKSSEVNLPADYFRNPERHLNMKNLVAHEYVHSWNGLFRQPADLWTPDLSTPMGDSLLWVYEGQTEYWAVSLAARAGQLSSSQALDLLAIDAAAAQSRPGRSWKSLADSNNDPLYDAGHAVPWPDWQRREDYYGEGVLLWLDVDTKIQELSSNKRSLADFARLFFGERDRDLRPHTYSFGALCSALNQVAPFDWQTFLQTRLQAHNASHLLDGLTRAGYQLVFSDHPSEIFRDAEVDDGVIDLSYSAGMKVANSGIVKTVSWQGPAFVAGISIGTRVNTVDGQSFTPQNLRAAVEDSDMTPLILGIIQDGKPTTVTIAYKGKLAYPHLKRIEGTLDRLSPWLTKRRGDGSRASSSQPKPLLIRRSLV
jgi:predicted metalloprotease with PDZ domain